MTEVIKKLNFFALSSIGHYYIVNYMVKNMEEFKNADNVLYLITPKIEIEKENRSWKKIIRLNSELYNGNLLFARRSINEEMEYLEKIFSSYNDVGIFLPALYKWNNIIYNHFLKNKKCHYYNYPDGNDSIYLKKVDKKTMFIRWLKCRISALFGIKYCWNSCFKFDYLGMSLAEKIYSYIPENIEDKVNSEIIKIPLKGVNKTVNNSNKCIFLGQTIEGGLKHNYPDKITECFEYIRRREGDNPIFYKAHPRENVALIKDFLEKYNFVLMNEEKSIESLAAELDAKTVYSFYSSGLINLKILLGDSIECVAYKGLEFYGIDKDNAEILKKTYHKLGVEYIGE